MLTVQEEKFIKELNRELNQALVVEDLPIVFKDISLASELIITTLVSEAKIVINKQLEKNVMDIARELCYQKRRLFQIEQAPFIDQALGTQWVDKLRQKNASNTSSLECDAQAYATYFLKKNYNITIQYPNQDIIDNYIKRSEDILNYPGHQNDTISFNH